MRKNDASGVFDYTLSNIAPSGPFRNSSISGVKITSGGKEEYLQQVTLDSAMRAIEMEPPKEDEAMRLAFFGNTIGDNQNQDSPPIDTEDRTSNDTIFSFRASFFAFSCSLIDKVPSEIALITLKDVDASATWNKSRTIDATCLISVGWLQVDNYVPSAPFPVAVRPVDAKNEKMETVKEEKEGLASEDKEKPTPLLLVGLTFAPKHKSGILVRSSY